MKDKIEVGAVPTIDYEFTAIPTNFTIIMDVYCFKLFAILLQKHTYWRSKGKLVDGYFGKSILELSNELGLSNHQDVRCTIEALFRANLIDVMSVEKEYKCAKFKLDFERIKELGNMSMYDCKEFGLYVKKLNRTEKLTYISPSKYSIETASGTDSGTKVSTNCTTTIDNIKNKNNKENNNIINNIKENIIRKQEENNHDFVNASSYFVKDDADDVKKDTSIEEIPFINKSPNAICASVGADITSNNEESEQIPTCKKENSDASTKGKEISITPTSDKECCMAEPTVSPIELLEEAKRQLQLAETFGELEDAFLKYKPQMKEFGGFYFKSLLNCQQECEKKFYHSSTEQYSGIGRLSFPI